MRMQREDMQNHVPGRILSATTLHGLLLLLGFVHYALLGGEGVADYASERDGGLFVVGLCGFAYLCLVAAYARRFQIVALSVLTMSTTLIWVTLSEDARVALSEPLTFATLIVTFFGMWLLLLRLRAVRIDDVREAAMRERRLNHRVFGRAHAVRAEPEPSWRGSGIDAAPWIVGCAGGVWLILPMLTLGAADWAGEAAGPERQILGVMAGMTLAIVSIYVAVLEPMLYVRDVPSMMSTKRALGVVGLVLLAACSLFAGWAILAGGPSA